MNIKSFTSHWSALLLVCFLMFTGGHVLAQETGITGKITAENTSAPLIYVNVHVLDGSNFVNGGVSASDGSYKVAPLEPRTYTVLVRFTGYDELRKENVVVEAGKLLELNLALKGGVGVVANSVVTSPAISTDSVVLTSVDAEEYDDRVAEFTVAEPVEERLEKIKIDRIESFSSGAVYEDAGGAPGVREREGRKDKEAGRTSSESHYFMDGTSVESPAKLAEGEAMLDYRDEIEGDVDMPEVQAGLLTAGEVNDFSKWGLWSGDFADEERNRWSEHWEFRPLQRYPVQLTNDNGWPIVDYPVKLLDAAGAVVWEARTDQSGRAELWAGMFAKEAITGEFRIAVTADGQTYEKKAKAFTKGITRMDLPVDCGASDVVDIMFVVDATGSMGDEIRYLQAELSDVIQKSKDRHKDLKMNLGSVFFRDKTDAYLVRSSPLAADHNQTVSFIKEQGAGGGGDRPEAVESALKEAIEMQPWHSNARARLLFLVLDAPPHHTPEIVKELQDLTQLAAKKGIRIIPLSGSGIQKDTEYLMRFLALGTNGTYTFLTDDSGIGGSHIKPTTDSYETEYLNDLLMRLIDQYTEVADCQQDEITSLPDSLVDNMQYIAEQQIVNNVDDAENVPLKIGIKVFPNPTMGQFKVEVDGKPKEIYITDLSGKILLRTTTFQSGKKANFDLTDYANGIYFVVAIFEEGAASERVVVQH